MTFHRITLVPAGDLRLVRKVTNWLTCRITDKPSRGPIIRRSRYLARFQSVISKAACQRDFVTNPVFIPVIRNNRKSGLGTPITFSNVPHFPVDSEKKAVGRIREALALCNDCPVLEECRNLTNDSNPPVAHGFVQAGIVFVEKVTDFKAQITEWNKDYPRSLRIPTKGRGAWTFRKIPTPKQYEEYITDLTTTKDFRAATLQMAIDSYEDTARELDELEPYEMDEAWADAMEKHG